MLDSKIDFIVLNEDNILNEVLNRYMVNLSLLGFQDTILGINIKIIIRLLQVSFLGDTIRLELYKKLNNILIENNLISMLTRTKCPTPAGSPYYYGVGAPGLDESEIQNLNIDISEKSDKTYTYSPTMEVFYVSYPKDYGLLTSILDNNGFETLPGWTQTEVTFVLGGVPIDYYVYEFNNLTTQVNFTNTFKY